MRGYLSIDFTISVVLLITFVSVVIYHYSLKVETLQNTSSSIIRSIELISNKAIKMINFSIFNLSYKSYTSFIRKDILVLWYDLCLRNYPTLTCEFFGSRMNCYINNTNIEIKPICHEWKNCIRWCKDQYFGRGIYPPYAGNRIYNIVYVR